MDSRLSKNLEDGELQKGAGSSDPAPFFCFLTSILCFVNLKVSMALITVLKEREKKKMACRQHAVNEVQRLASLLRDHYEFESIYMFGSILTDNFRHYSDIDLVIKGIKINDFFKAHALLIKESSYKIDLKPFEDLTEDFKKKVLSRGIRIG
jgi:predicted nucleotidyltransferase